MNFESSFWDIILFLCVVLLNTSLWIAHKRIDVLAESLNKTMDSLITLWKIHNDMMEQTMKEQQGEEWKNGVDEFSEN